MVRGFDAGRDEFDAGQELLASWLCARIGI
jgi:hypothetical protein